MRNLAGSSTPRTTPATSASECHSWSGVVITKINGAAHGVESGVSHLGLAYGGNPVAPPAHRPNASGPLRLSVD